YTPDPNFNGTDTITYTISDGNGGTDAAVVTVTVNPVNDNPAAFDDVASTNEDTPATITVLANDSDVDGDPLTVTGASASNGAEVINPDGTLSYTPDPNFNGTDTITYTISDGNGGTDTAVVTVTVDEAPDAVADIAIVSIGEQVGGNVLTNDAFDGDGAGTPRITQVVVGGTTYTDGDNDGYIVATGTYGTLTLNTATGDYVYQQTGAITANRTDVFQYTIQDSDGDTSSANLTVSIPLDAPIHLTGLLTTNTNSSDQALVVTFQDLSSPYNISATIYSMNVQGGGTGVTDQYVGFNIDYSHDFLYAVEAGQTSSPTNINVTQYQLEGVVTNGAGGADNWSLRYDNSGPGTRDTAITGIISPDDVTQPQGPTSAADGNSTSQSLTDSTSSTVHYLFGAGGTDTLTGSSGADMLNGGSGADEVSGGGGNDILVFDAVDAAISGATTGFLDGGAGSDVLRIDDGAIALFNNSLLTSSTVDLRGLDIRNIEVILITEELDRSGAKGTTIRLDAADVINWSGDAMGNDTLYLVGSDGDTLQISATDAANWVDGDGNAANGVTKTGSIVDSSGHAFDIYATTAGGTLHVDQDITVVTS
ncbi:MAG: tandem-95 repeat protein, partial [Dongiaceae bacterium]